MSDSRIDLRQRLTVRCTTHHCFSYTRQIDTTTTTTNTNTSSLQRHTYIQYIHNLNTPHQSKMSSTTPQPDSTTTKPKYNLRNPLPLSAAQEAEVKQLYYKRVRSLCAPEIKGESFSPYPNPGFSFSNRREGKVLFATHTNLWGCVQHSPNAPSTAQ